MPGPSASPSRRRLLILCFVTAFAVWIIGQTLAPANGTASAWAEKATGCTGGSGTAQAVCVAAESFAAILTSSQQSSLYYELNAENASAWSNLPCGSSCRNGVRFDTLSSTQLEAALAVAQAALSTAGYGTFDGIRAADDYLSTVGGGGQYNSGIYFIAFLGTPSSTDPWMLQLGGHHYALNFYFHGSYTSPTPYFTGVEPLSFTLNGQTYTPMQNKANAAKAMLDGLSSSELSSAQLSGSFDDVLVGPGEDGQFPAQSGLRVSTLSAQQQALVVDAIEAWVNEMPSSTANRLLSAYTSDAALNNTYIGWAGGTELATQGSYIRIDGPRVWIEIVAQGGVVIRNQIHYHSVWRDKAGDYGANDTGTEEPVPGTIAFTSSSFQAQESARNATIRVQRSGGTDGVVSIEYAVTGGSATAGSDYQNVSGTLTWEDGEDGSKTFQVPLINNSVAEGSETVVLTLSNPSGDATLGTPSSATLTITDDDASTAAGAFAFASTLYRTSEGAGSVTVSVRRMGGTQGAVSVRLGVGNGAATGGVDYRLPTMRVLRWASGDSSTKSLQVTIVNDTRKEPTERFQLVLASPTGGASLGAPAVTTVALLDND